MEENINIKKQKLLFVGVGFRNYDKLIVKELTKRYDVVYVNSKEFDMQHRVFYKIARSIARRTLEKCCASHIMKQLREKAIKVDKLFVIKGEHLTREHLDYIKQHNEIERSVLYLWDKWAAHENIEDIKLFFNEIYSFDTDRKSVV